MFVALYYSIDIIKAESTLETRRKIIMERKERFADLPPKTRQFFEGLREEDIILLQDGLRLVRSVQTISKFMKWTIITLIGAFIAAVGLAENIMKVIGWFRGSKG